MSALGPAIITPAFQKESFHCPNCSVLAHQIWHDVNAVRPGMGAGRVDNINLCLCSHCYKFSIWHDENLLFPATRTKPRPNADMNAEIVGIYEEAALISDMSPKGAAALLRLCLQLLCVQLGEKGKNINDDIKSLVSKGLPVEIQQALDVVRVIGNNAVHPGEISVGDRPDTVDALFVLLNAIADRMLTQPRQIAMLYGSLPQSIQLAIEKRDGGS